MVKEAVWSAKPNEIVKATTPEELAKKGIIVNPDSLVELWGPRAPKRYAQTLGIVYVPDTKLARSFEKIHMRLHKALLQRHYNLRSLSPSVSK